jgi:hypothetical protein
MINHKAAWFWYSNFTGVTICFHVMGVNVIAAAGGFVFVTMSQVLELFSYV